VRMISDSLPIDTLAPLLRLGYNASVERIDWRFLRSAETEVLVDFWLSRRHEVIRKPRFRAAKQSDLVRVLYVFAQGGLYFDLDTIFVAPLPQQLSFVTFWHGPPRGKLGAASNDAVFKGVVVTKVHNGIFGFSSRGAPFLRHVLPVFLRCGSELCSQPKFWAPNLTVPLLHPSWDSAGPPVFSHAVHTLSSRDSCGLTLLSDSSVLGWWLPEDAERLTRLPIDGPTVKLLNGFLTRGAYAAHLYTSHTGSLAVHQKSLFGLLLDRSALHHKHADFSVAEHLRPQWMS
jgi:hypothetical protein